MKVKTSVTLSQDLLDDISRHAEPFRSRSELIEFAVRRFLNEIARNAVEQRDLAIINEHAEALNAEAEDSLAYQAPL